MVRRMQREFARAGSAALADRRSAFRFGFHQHGVSARADEYRCDQGSLYPLAELAELVAEAVDEEVVAFRAGDGPRCVGCGFRVRPGAIALAGMPASAWEMSWWRSSCSSFQSAAISGSTAAASR